MLVHSKNIAIPAFGLFSAITVQMAFANGWGEQGAPGFRYTTQGVATEIYRVQLGATVVSSAAATASSSRSSGGIGTAQSSDQLNNVVQITNNATYNIQVDGNDNYLNFDTKVDANQTSQDSSLVSANTGTAYRYETKTLSETYLNK